MSIDINSDERQAAVQLMRLNRCHNGLNGVVTNGVQREAWELARQGTRVRMVPRDGDGQIAARITGLAPSFDIGPRTLSLDDDIVPTYQSSGSVK